MTTEHQPGSPGVDLDELDREGHEWDHGQLLRAARSLGARLRTLRARVAELEAENREVEASNDELLSQHVRLERLEKAEARAESAEARMKELEAAADRNANVIYADESVERYRKRITDLESQLAAAREEQGLEAKVREVLGERFFQVRIARYHEFWQAEWREVVRGETLERFADAETLPALLRAILAVEKGGPDEG